MTTSNGREPAQTTSRVEDFAVSLVGLKKNFALWTFAKQLIQTCTFNNSPSWAMHFKKSGPKVADTKPHASLVTCQRLLGLGWNAFSHSLYIYPWPCVLRLLFISFQAELLKWWHFLKTLTTSNQSFLVAKIRHFLKVTLPERWQKVIDSNWRFLVEKSLFLSKMFEFLFLFKIPINLIANSIY